MSFLKRVGFLAVMAVSTLGLISGASGVEARQATTYTVEIENLTKGQPVHAATARQSHQRHRPVRGG